MSEDSPHIYRFIGIGFGPSNIALAIALEEAGELDNVLFLEKAAAPDWQGEFLIDGSDIQHNPLRDFVTPRNPAFPYGFLSYLKAKGRLFEFLNLEAPYPPRTEYARFTVWAARQFDRAVRYSAAVRSLEYTEAGGLPAVRVGLESGEVFLARSVSFAPGRSISIPQPFAAHMGGRMVHAAQYRSAVARWQEEGTVRRIAVIGASQSAVEMLLDLPGHFPQAQITGICRSFGYKQKDLSPFTERVYEPEFVDRFYDAPEDVQNSMRRELWRSNYGAADHDVINALQFRMYEQRVTGRAQIVLLDNKTTQEIAPQGGAGGFELTLLDRMDRSETRAEFDAVILATGFLNHGSAPEGEPFHPLLAGIAAEARFRADGAIAQARDYRLLIKPGLTRAPVFLNGVSETSHGFGDAGSFSLLSVRSAELARSIAAVPVRPQNNSSGAGQDTPARTVQPA
ncbi:SidA/IucD/PvdA family monooxygenase (plasmid) [Leisingera sp. S132]|uniref:lysine N(6)-hydroxylase/L-ornithine N(5)-oxygenase family protein n=1 Tax=Leisingera sp. S132 TaxID=2867016 RepID=UPI0021A716D3|nr:SidA/IucD/PvdA family monooxygenase [Leisingera sp. S132]UWQ81689.1 SidA/IucD/PvdA family monooxygenase [Leisingera sp. S132]